MTRGLLIISSVKMRITGSRMPFSDCATRITFTSGRPGMIGHGRRHEHEEGDDAVEDRRLAERAVEAGLEAEGLADDVGGGQRQHAGGEDRDAEQAEAEEVLGGGAEERLERHGRLLRRLDDDALLVERRGAGHDDEEVDASS